MMALASLRQIRCNIINPCTQLPGIKIYILGIPPLPESMIVLIGLLAQIGFLVNRFRLRVLSALASF